MRPTHSIIVQVFLALTLLTLCLPAQALDLMKPFKSLFSADETVVWQGPGQFVKVVDQDRIRPDRRPPPNAHPADITPQQLGAVLASLQTQSGGRNVPLFTQAEVTLLAQHLAEAFDKALPEQDVVFAVADVHPDLAQKDRRTTAARLFLQGGYLHIIFGDVHGPSDGKADNISHFSKPHRSGKRGERVDRSVLIAAGPGITHFQGSERIRTDWVLVDVNATVAAYRGPMILPTPPAAATLPVAATPGTAVPVAAPVSTTLPGAAVTPSTAEQERLAQERRQMVEEMARLKKQLAEQQGAAAAPATPATPAAAATPAATAGALPGAADSAQPAAATDDSLEARLARLQALHAKKLITDEEYAAKRKELLKEL